MARASPIQPNCDHSSAYLLCEESGEIIIIKYVLLLCSPPLDNTDKDCTEPLLRCVRCRRQAG